MEERHQSEMRRTCVSVIAKHIQLLSTAIDKERSDRVQAISEVHVQFNELLYEFRTFASISGSRVRDARHDDARIDEISSSDLV